VGITRARKEIQIDRYSDISKEGLTIDYIDTANRMKGWKANLSRKGVWIRYNAIEFGSQQLKAVSVMGTSVQGGVIEIRLDKMDGTLIGTTKLSKSGKWEIKISHLLKAPSGKHDLFIVLKDANPVSIDWLQFN
jgi:hypothetical protein